MSHDRGCFRCFEDPPYTHCKDSDCPKLGRGQYSVAAIEARWAKYRVIEDDRAHKEPLKFWRETL